MPLPIQVIPQGLQSLLGITGARNPSDLNELVSPIVDLTPRYLSRFLGVQVALSAPTAVNGTTVTLTVPQGRAWDVVAVGAACTQLAAGVIVPMFEINILGCPVLASAPTGTLSPGNVNANNDEPSIGCFTPGLVLSPGMTIQNVLRSTLANTTVLRIVALVRELNS